MSVHLNIKETFQPVLFARTRENNSTSQLLMYNSQLSVIANYRACLLESRDLVDPFLWLCVYLCNQGF